MGAIRMLGSLSSRERAAIYAFGGGAFFLLLVFAAGAFMGRFSGPSQPTPPVVEASTAGPEQVETERFLVEAGSFDSPATGEDTLLQLRRQYTSAWGATDPDDRRYHVYAGPYLSSEAEKVASELRARGLENVTIRPYSPKSPAR